MTTVTRSSSTNPARGVVRIVIFNWPKYVAAAVIVLAAIAVLPRVSLPWPWAALLLAFAGLLAFWSVASLIVSFWVYDASPLADWRWLRRILQDPDGGMTRWVNIHAGYDDTSVHLARMLPIDSATVVDLYDRSQMTERSIHRARRFSASPAGTKAARPDRLPLADASCDWAFLLFSAHEIRSGALRAALFTEVRRALRPGGKLLVVEHVRDFWNALAFGPGVFHFYSRREWLRGFSAAGLAVIDEGTMTPFVRYFLLENPI